MGKTVKAPTKKVDSKGNKGHYKVKDGKVIFVAKGAGKKPPKPAEEVDPLLQAAKAGTAVKFGPAIQDFRTRRAQEAGQGDLINRTYAAYRGELDGIQAMRQSAMKAVTDSQAAMAAGAQQQAIGTAQGVNGELAQQSAVTGASPDMQAFQAAMASALAGDSRNQAASLAGYGTVEADYGGRAAARSVADQGFYQDKHRDRLSALGREGGALQTQIGADIVAGRQTLQDKQDEIAVARASVQDKRTQAQYERDMGRKKFSLDEKKYDLDVTDTTHDNALGDQTLDQTKRRDAAAAKDKTKPKEMSAEEKRSRQQKAAFLRRVSGEYKKRLTSGKFGKVGDPGNGKTGSTSGRVEATLKTKGGRGLKTHEMTIVRELVNHGKIRTVEGKRALREMFGDKIPKAFL